ncbi:snaclec coagulation factor IX-binding protein subunit A-like [Anticarsia gemmatalis]|uniref:snaclec coagulation factor IX-binding protein subunit A-like n=1 Tax=Anticarsia gemmatalis TaxID=129554 RepID=UPI003F76277B
MFVKILFTVICVGLILITAFEIETAARVIEKRAAEAEGSCEIEGYKFYSNSCYKYHDEQKTWREANSTCVDEGSHLVVINTKDEGKLLKSKNILRNSEYGTHVGLQYDVEEKKWTSVLGEAMEDLFHEWSEGSTPDDDIITCGVIIKTLKLLSWPCDGEYGIYQPFVCEIELDL